MIRKSKLDQYHKMTSNDKLRDIDVKIVQILFR